MSHYAIPWGEGGSLEVYPGLHLTKMWGKTYCLEKLVYAVQVFLLLLFKIPI